MAGVGHGVEPRGRAFTARATAALTKLQYARLVSVPAAVLRIVRLNNHATRTTHQANPEQQNGRTVERYRSFCIDRLLLVHSHSEPNPQAAVAIVMLSFWAFTTLKVGEMFGVSLETYARCVQV